MFRAMGMFGLGIIFLVISPGLRLTVTDGIQGVGTFMDQNSPLSYVGLGVLILIGLMIMVYRAAQPR